VTKTNMSELERLEAKIRLIIEMQIARDLERYGDHDQAKWMLDYFNQQLEFAKKTAVEKYGADLAQRLREQKKYLRNAYVHGGKPRGLRRDNIYVMLDQISRLRERESNPPRWSEYVLYLILPKEERETVPGDLVEEYRAVILPKFGATAARMWFVKQTLSSIWPFLKRRVWKALGFASLLRLLK
jgi:hypothetical protein